MDENYVILDIETCPIHLDDNYFNLDEKEKLKLLNPIDSRIVAIGFRHKDRNRILINMTEKDILESFWNIIPTNHSVRIVGFNINSFDMPFIIARCLINDVQIPNINIKNDMIDLREYINFHQYGQKRGKLKEYAKSIGLEITDNNGGDVAEMVYKAKYDVLVEYLIKDIEITDEIYKRCVKLNILGIKKW